MKTEDLDTKMTRHAHLPLELLQTFVAIADHDGDATAAASDLRISQPTISKRLSSLRRLTTDPDQSPWLLLKGKRWSVTPEGDRVQGVVRDVVKRYAAMEQFVAEGMLPPVSVASGQLAASGFVNRAIRQLLKEEHDCRVRLSTPRGEARIRGVAEGEFDMAIVTDPPSTIRKVAGSELYVEDLFEDRFVLVAAPAGKCSWAAQWNALPVDRPVAAKDLVGLPFILPEPDASRRQQFDEWFQRATGQQLNAVLQIGGWQAIVDFARAGVGVGLVADSAVRGGGASRRAEVRSLDPETFPPDGVRLIARKVHGKSEPELSPVARKLFQLLRSEAASK